MLIDLTFKKDSGFDLNQITVVLCTLYTLPAWVWLSRPLAWRGWCDCTHMYTSRIRCDVTSRAILKELSWPASLRLVGNPQLLWKLLHSSKLPGDNFLVLFFLKWFSWIIWRNQVSFLVIFCQNSTSFMENVFFDVIWPSQTLFNSCNLAEFYY